MFFVVFLMVFIAVFKDAVVKFGIFCLVIFLIIFFFNVVIFCLFGFGDLFLIFAVFFNRIDVGGVFVMNVKDLLE